MNKLLWRKFFGVVDEVGCNVLNFKIKYDI